VIVKIDRRSFGVRLCHSADAILFVTDCLALTENLQDILPWLPLGLNKRRYHRFAFRSISALTTAKRRKLLIKQALCDRNNVSLGIKE
jgi:hypothetical protein